MDDAEPLLVVDDHEAEHPEGHVLRQHPVGADDDVDGAGAQALDGGVLLLRGAETAEHLDADGVGAEPVGEGGVVLLREDGGGARGRPPAARPARALNAARTAISVLP